MNQALIQDVVTEVMRRLGSFPASDSGPRAGEHAAVEVPKRLEAEADPHRITVPIGRNGVFGNVDEAVRAATEAQKKLLKLSMEDRDGIVKLVKSIAKQNMKPWGEIEFAETKIGRLDHKMDKLRLLELIPGVEMLKSNVKTGSNGICLEEFAPFGVIGIITPVTHSIPTLTANMINMIAAGNSIVANPHPSGASCAAVAVAEYNKQIGAKYGIENLVTCVVPPTLETADAIFNHRGISLLVVTGGPAVARAALASRKRAIVAGPGNPPVVVDETACLNNAAESIIKGASFDNNLMCIAEKQVFCVESVFDQLMAAMEKYGGYRLDRAAIDRLTKVAFNIDPKDNSPHVNKDLVGADPAVLARHAGVSIPPATQLLFGETDFNHAFVQEEQMMPFVPFVRVRDVDEAIDKAIESEHGYRHTAIIHSRNLDTITRFGRRAATTIFVVNGACAAGVGMGGEGYGSYSIATPTGEGITNPMTFTRYRRMMISGSLRMI